MCTPDYAAAYRARAAAARADGGNPIVADWCDEQAREHERLAASSLEARDHD